MVTTKEDFDEYEREQDARWEAENTFYLTDHRGHVEVWEWLHYANTNPI